MLYRLEYSKLGENEIQSVQSQSIDYFEWRLNS